VHMYTQSTREYSVLYTCTYAYRVHH